MNASCVCVCQVAAQYVMSPPIRNKEHQKQIKDGLAGGVLSIVATDHCPFNSTQKRRGLHDFRDIPNGVNGIEERLHITWNELVNKGGFTMQLTAVQQAGWQFPFLE